MIVINIDKVLQEADEHIDEEEVELLSETKIKQLTDAEHGKILKESQLWDLDNQINELRVHRAKESNKHPSLVVASLIHK